MRHLIIGGLLALSLSVTGSAAAASAEAYLAKAREFLNNGEVKAAAIELKNTLQADPTLVEARIMLGEIYLQLGYR